MEVLLKHRTRQANPMSVEELERHKSYIKLVRTVRSTGHMNACLKEGFDWSTPPSQGLDVTMADAESVSAIRGNRPSGEEVARAGCFWCS